MNVPLEWNVFTCRRIAITAFSSTRSQTLYKQHRKEEVTSWRVPILVVVVDTY